MERPVIVCLHLGGAGDGFFCQPDDEFEVDRAVAKADQPDLWRATGHVVIGPLDFLCRLKAGLADEFLVGAIGDAEADPHPAAGFAQGPVDDLTFDELFIGDQNVDIVVRSDKRRADVDLLDQTGHAGLKLNEIADFHRLFKQDDDA